MNKNISTIDTYSTQSLALAAALSLWFPIESIDRTDSRKVKFYFLRNEQLDQVIETFWKREMRVEPLAYFSQLKFIKSRIYER